MAEQFFVILTTESQRSNADEVVSLLKEHGISDPDVRDLEGNMLEIRAQQFLDVPEDSLVMLCQSLAKGDDWYRVFECDEYGTEIFWYIDSETRWRLRTEQDFPNADTLKAYRDWYMGLDQRAYGAVHEADLAVLEQKYGLFDEHGTPVNEPTVPLTRQVGSNLEFLGNGITVPHAGGYWDWYIPDIGSLAQKTAVESKFPPADGAVTYRRSFMADGDPGYAWSWDSNGTEVILLFLFSGSDGTYRRLVINTMSITIDEAFLLAYCQAESADWIDIPEDWICDPNDEYNHESLDGMDISPEDVSGINVFNGRIISTRVNGLIRRGAQLHIVEDVPADDERPCLTLLPHGLDAELKAQLPSIHARLDEGTFVRAKLKLKSETEVSELLTVKFMEFDERDLEVEVAEFSGQSNRR